MNTTPQVSILTIGWVLILNACQSADANRDTDNTPSSENEQDTASDSSMETDSQTDSDEEWESDTLVDSFTQVEVSEIGEVPFDTDNILEYHINMRPSLYEEMKKSGNDEAYREASLRVRSAELSEDYAKIGVRYKGDYSLHHCWSSTGMRNYGGDCAKLSIRLKFNKYNRDARFFGLKNINLHAMSADDSKLRERLAYSLFNAFGVKTVRTAHAKLYINDEEPVLVLAVEQIDGRYSAYRYPNGGDGNIFEDSWPMSSLSESTLFSQLRTNDDPEDNPDVSDYIAFGNAVRSADKDTFAEDMAAFLDLDNMLRYMAVDRAIKNWDGITAFYWPDRPHNYYWYHDNGEENRFHLIPWDMDKTMWGVDPYMDPSAPYADKQVPNWNVLPLSCERIRVWNSSDTVMPPGCDHFMELLASVLWDDFEAIGNELLDTVLKYDAIDEAITRWAEQIAPIVDADPFLNPTSWESHVENFREEIQKNIEDFEGHILEGYVVEQEPSN